MNAFEVATMALQVDWLKSSNHRCLAEDMNRRCQLLQLVHTMVQEAGENQRSKTPRYLEQHSEQKRLDTLLLINSSIVLFFSCNFCLLSTNSFKSKTYNLEKKTYVSQSFLLIIQQNLESRQNL